ncbi:unnamed protein product [Ectocarpus sp. CCAP 1310/34]|nr:unnamed protein product [Ectocarpus sp. CCAP 1310/34]
MIDMKTIGRTERKYLLSESRVITPALTISSIPVVYGYYVDGYGYDDDDFYVDDDDDNDDDDDDDNDDDNDDKSTRSSLSSTEYTTTSSTLSSSTFSPSEASTTPPGASRQRRQRRRLVSSSSSSSSTSDTTSYDDGVDSWTYFSGLDDDSFTFLRADDTSASSPSFSGGFLNIYVLQGSYSLIIIEDIDPLDIGDLLGNIGGFWGYVLLSFAVFFTVAEPEKLPRLRARAFYTKRGTDEIIRRLSATSSTSKSPDASQGATEVREQPPDWEDERNGGQGEAEGKSEGETPAIPSLKNPTPFMIRGRSSTEDRETRRSQRPTSVVVEGEPVAGLKDLG